MALSTSYVPQNIRAAGSVVANAAAFSSSVAVPTTMTQKLMVFIDFTLGSLTNGIFTPQVSYDGTNWYDVTSPAALTLTANGKKAFVVDVTGAKLFRVQLTSTGTTTSSDAKVDVGFQKS